MLITYHLRIPTKGCFKSFPPLAKSRKFSSTLPLFFKCLLFLYFFFYFRVLNLSNEYVLNCSSLNTFLSAKSPTIITKLDLGNCYWFDPSLLVKLIARLSSSLTSLHIQGTKLCSSQIADILAACPQIVELSVSFSKKDNTFWLPLGSYHITGDFVQDTIKSSVFHGLESNLNRLTWLSLHGSENCFRQFLVFLWYLIIINTYFQNKIKVYFNIFF